MRTPPGPSPIAQPQAHPSHLKLSAVAAAADAATARRAHAGEDDEAGDATGNATAGRSARGRATVGARCMTLCKGENEAV